MRSATTTNQCQIFRIEQQLPNSKQSEQGNMKRLNVAIGMIATSILFAQSSNVLGETFEPQYALGYGNANCKDWLETNDDKEYKSPHSQWILGAVSGV